MDHQIRMVLGQAFVLVGDGQVVEFLLGIEDHLLSAAQRLAGGDPAGVSFVD